MAQKNINTGAAANDGTGDTLRGAMVKIQDNFTELYTGKLDASKVGAANGAASLDGSQKLLTSQLPSSIVGALNYVGGWNASTNTPALPAASANKGSYYTVTKEGSSSVPSGSTKTYNVGDWIVSNGTTYDQILGQTPSATTTATGAIQLAGDLAGTATAPTVAKIGGVAVAAYDDANKPLTNGTAASGTSASPARNDHVHPTDATRAPLASPTFTGTPAAPTAAVNTNTTQLATTAFVLGQLSSTAPLANATAQAGSSLRTAREDHVHPVPTQIKDGSYSLTCNSSGYVEIDANGSLWTFYNKNSLLNGHLSPRGTAGQWNLGGTTTLRWGTAFISSLDNSSDQRLKTPIEVFPESLLDAWATHIRWGQFVWLKDGPDGKLNGGLIAQDVQAAFDAAGLDWRKYDVVRESEEGELSVDYLKAQAIENAMVRRKLARI